MPKQISTGGRTILGKISKRGNKYLRTLYVQAARVVLAGFFVTTDEPLWPLAPFQGSRLPLLS